MQQKATLGLEVERSIWEDAVSLKEDCGGACTTGLEQLEQVAKMKRRVDLVG